MNKKITLAMIMAATLFIFAGCNDSTSNTAVTETNDTTIIADVDTAKNDLKADEGMMGKMTSMMDKMKGTTMKGDFDLDFIALMIEHHQGAVDISEMALKAVADPQIKTLAQTMVTDHTSEIDELRKFMNSHDTSSAEHKKAHVPGHSHDGKNHEELSEDMSSMMDKIKGIPMTGNADNDYVTLMMAHHESAIKLSEDELDHGHHAELKKMAKKMISDDKKEVKELQNWLASKK